MNKGLQQSILFEMTSMRHYRNAQEFKLRKLYKDTEVEEIYDPCMQVQICEVCGAEFTTTSLMKHDVVQGRKSGYFTSCPDCHPFWHTMVYARTWKQRQAAVDAIRVRVTKGGSKHMKQMMKDGAKRDEECISNELYRNTKF